MYALHVYYELEIHLLFKNQKRQKLFKIWLANYNSLMFAINIKNSW